MGREVTDFVFHSHQGGRFKLVVFNSFGPFHVRGGGEAWLGMWAAIERGSEVPLYYQPWDVADEYRHRRGAG